VGLLEKKLDELAASVVTQADLTRARVEASTAETLRGVRLDGALSRPIRINAEVFSNAGRLVGWSLRVANSDVTITFHDGHSADGDPIATTVIKAGASDTVGLPGAGVAFVDALWAEVTFTTPGPTVALTGATWIGDVR
jgi:hypothetical protein